LFARRAELYQDHPVTQLNDIDTSGLPQDLDPYQQLARSSEQAEFVRRVPAPILLFTRNALWDPSLLKKRSATKSGRTGVAKMREIELDEHGFPFVSPIRKRDATNAAVSLGRAPTNDIIVPIPSISSLHCSFAAPGPQQWSITDHGSSNGTFIDHVRIARDKTVTLADGAHVRFSKDVTAWFLSPARFFAILRDDRVLAEHTEL
jgi:pSer/pThr/pTyr-binding forkhead associated (FHA) protein